MSARFEALRDAPEERDDVAIYDAARERAEESFPIALFDAIDAGANPVRVFREYRKTGLRELARTIGISPSFLSDIETGKKEGGVGTLKALAVALRVDLDMLA
jgi:DNA-binding XRE family transcriptional regulator